ncbi:MAG: sulfatase, partial [Patescibacteria group bacterium]|nr:sulfatase [Patescibacteria group bacterium]
MNIICLVLDCLHSGFLGPYGNMWIETPAFDRLASQAFTFDASLVDSPRLDRLCDSYWHVKHV